MDWGKNNVNAGPLPEMKEICIDHFVGKDLDSTAFFLSHAHTDHTVGLETEAFLERLKEPGIKLYCQAITPILLGDFERYLGGEAGIEELVRCGKLVPLDAEKTVEIEIPAKTSSYFVELTLLPAGHCPGSVMFLFESGSKRILHTGDCRISVDDLKVMRHLHVGPLSSGHVKSIDHLFVDSTFCSKNAEVFPDRRIAFEEAINYVRNHLKRGDKYYIKLKFAARFAHEYIIQELFKVFRHKIHVNKNRFMIYEQIPGLRDCVTLSPSTPFHLCDKTAQAETRSPIMKKGGFLTVCYSMHSSLTEIAKMIDYLKPVAVTPVVKPNGCSMQEVQEALISLCAWRFEYEDYQSGKSHLMTEDSVSCDKSPRPLDGNEDAEECCISLPKRAKIDESNSKWNYCFTPSPTKSANSSRENSPEIIADVLDFSTLDNNPGTSKVANNLKHTWRKQDFHENHGF
ncbi:unnamed protein product [Allacma fusca]|uniref:Metallo-beta-lactamase domain-containing protein n=1 Tax=Allacma fusca TaxID=39272 RepID=A0A8J2PW67_9HEXA|nr:unnamed protein product [Allacma fusca]